MVLNGILRLFEDKKPEMMASCKIRMIAMLTHNKTGYVDDVDFSDISSHNVIGAAVRALMKDSVIVQTGNHKRSQRPGSNGRVIWEYQLA